LYISALNQSIILCEPYLCIFRGANPMIVDGRGKTPLQRAMEMGAITDDELFLLLSEHNR
jgi:Arf-GAP/coiled-coil/ANK repeat/PH domain-containing protein